MRTLLVGVAALIILQVELSTTTAEAEPDLLRGTRSEQLVERSHSVQMTIDRGHATLIVQRTFFNGGPQHDQALLDVYLPAGAVATGLRTLGTLHGRPHWFEGELMEAEEAAAQYQQLTGIGGATPKDPALLSWRWQSHLLLQVFPCAPAAPKTVAYTLLMPTDYRDGRYVVSLPYLGTQELAATATLRPARPRDQLLLQGQPLAAGSRVSLDHAQDIELVPFSPPRVDGALATCPTGLGSAVSRWQLNVAARLSEVPRQARVVVALDTSRSMGRRKLQAATTALRAYLSHFDTAGVEVVDFDRVPRRRYGRFVSPRFAAADLARRSVPLGNGSSVDAALGLADELLADHAGPTRIVLVTDARTRSSLVVEDLTANLYRSRAVVHLATIDEGSPRLERDDEHRFAAAARQTGGLFWTAIAPLDNDGFDTTRRIFEEWARPLRLEYVRLLTQGRDDLEGPPTLDEGATVRRLIVDKPVNWIELRGELWSQEYRKVWHPDAEESQRWAALVFGDSIHERLSEAEMMTLAMRGGAVSPVTSYLAIEPGVRPSTEGLPWPDEIGDAWGAGGLGLGGLGLTGIGEGGGGSSFDPKQALQDLLDPAWAHCGGSPGTAHLAIETTSSEIVDVPQVELDEQNVTQRACLVEAVWNLALSEQFEYYFAERFELTV